MARWEPDARGRLEKAAMTLFQERGYERTTVEEIAARAGLTERTFFRYFADKREVLFSGSKDLEKGIVDRIAAAPREASPFDAVAAAFEGHADLQERELIKLAALAAAATKALLARGVPDPTASLVAEMGIALF